MPITRDDSEDTLIHQLHRVLLLCVPQYSNQPFFRFITALRRSRTQIYAQIYAKPPVPLDSANNIVAPPPMLRRLVVIAFCPVVEVFIVGASGRLLLRRGLLARQQRKRLCVDEIYCCGIFLSIARH